MTFYHLLYIYIYIFINLSVLKTVRKLRDWRLLPPIHTDPDFLINECFLLFYFSISYFIYMCRIKEIHEQHQNHRFRNNNFLNGHI